MDHTFTPMLLLADGTVHAPPITMPSIEQAHEAMRGHCDCRAWRCPVKATAQAVLIGTGRIVPDVTKPR